MLPSPGILVSGADTLIVTGRGLIDKIPRPLLCPNLGH